MFNPFYVGPTLLVLQFLHCALTSKQTVDILKLQTLRLWEEKVDDWYPGCVERSENNISAPSDVINRWRRDLHDNVVADPICCCRDG
jgi:hypothetical protein